MVVLSSPLAMAPMRRRERINVGIQGQGFTDAVRSLKRSFGRVAKPVLRQTGRKAKNYAINRVAPNVADFVKNTVLPEGSKLIQSAVESKMRGEPVNFRQNLKKSAQRVGQQGQRRAIEQYKDASQFAQKTARQGANRLQRRANAQKGRIAKDAVRNLQKGNNKTASTVGNLLSQQLAGSGLYRY